MKSFSTTAAGFLLTAAMFLMPLKFGGLAAMPDAAGNFPSAWWEYIIITWPPHLPGVIGAAALILLLIGGHAGKLTFNAAGKILIFWSFVIPLATLPGWINAANSEYAVSQTLHFAGCGAFIAAAGLLTAADRHWRSHLLNALAAGVFFLGIHAWHQHLYGLEETRKFVAEQAARSGISAGEGLALKLTDNRIYATFAAGNALAGFLLLILPVVFLTFRNWSRKFEPQKLSQWIFSAVILLLTVPPLLLTGSRGAVLALLCTAGIWGFTSVSKRKIRILLAAVIFAAAGAGVWYSIHSGRKFSTMAERVDYLRTSVIMLCDHPLTGAGWGNFTNYHMRHKLTDTDEAARDPHNPVASFAGQCGIPAALAVLAALLYPLWTLWRKRRESQLNTAVLLGGTAFSIHTLMEVNFMVPADVITAGVLYIAAMMPENIAPAASPTSGRKQMTLSAAAAGIMFAILAAAAGYGNLRWLAGEAAFSRFQEAVHPLPGSVPGDPFAASLQAMRLRGSSPFVLELEADRLIQAGDLSGAGEVICKALKTGGERPGLYRRLAEIARLRGDHTGYRLNMKKAHRLFPKNPKYRIPE